MAQDIFEFWSRIRKGQKIHPADENAFRRIDAERHGFRLECLPGSYGGRLRTAPVVLLFLSPGFAKKDLKDAKDKDAREYYFQKLKGNTPLRDQPGNPGTDWIMSRTRHFGAWEDVRNNVAVHANSWPRLLGRILFIFFGGNRPAVRDLRLDASFNELTADIKESWASCFWTIQVCLDAARRYRENSALLKSIESLAQRLYAITQLHEMELNGPSIMGVISAMNDRYAKRLGFDPNTIEKAHHAEITKLNAARVASN